ncbi:hypothetical protein U9M48_044201 [Paspalum notatum var. saurae]|uniref:DDE Tnp4 domain-containing protein n=1 Tax=Paspalum notatum var. saurae TaxID=547442 RepID=A0AAQ3UUK4_PASNO
MPCIFCNPAYTFSFAMDNNQQLYLTYCSWRQKALIVLVLMLFLWWRTRDGRKYRRRGIKYGPLLSRDVWRNSELIRLIDTSDRTCISQLRMCRALFYKLCARLRESRLLGDTFHVSVEEQVAMFLKIVGQHHTNAAVGFSMWRSGETVSRYFNIVLFAMGELARELIHIRSTDTHAKITSNPNRFYPYFEGCLGALDGTHIRACVPAKMVDRFRGRKSYPTQNVLAVVDFDLRFTYVLAGWEGSAHDSLVLQDALSRPSGLKIPEGKFYLADAGYAARPGILPPYRGVRYHLQEFLGPNDPQCPKELFNHRHSSLRTTVERAFGTLKNRFKILSNKPFIPLKSQPKVVVACCAIHNWILDNGPDEFVLDEATWYSHLPRSRNRVSDYEADIREWAVKRDLIAQQMMGKPKDIVKSDEGVSRDKYANWSDEETKFMLEWYIGVQKDKPNTFCWKQPHHLQCADALNAKFSNGVTRNQVTQGEMGLDKSCSKSGYGFDATAKKFNIDPLEKDPNKLGVSARTAKYNYLTKPIKFYNLLEELFANSSQADGELALDQTTVNVPSGSDDSDGVKEVENYQMTVEDGNESDTIARDSPTTDGTISSKKRKRVPSKSDRKGKARCRSMNDEVSASIVRLCDTLISVKPADSSQNVVKSEEPIDPNASLWRHIDGLTITAKDKNDIASFLSQPSQETFSGYLKVASDTAFQAWVIDFLDRKYGGAVVVQ